MRFPFSTLMFNVDSFDFYCWNILIYLSWIQNCLEINSIQFFLIFPNVLIINFIRITRFINTCKNNTKARLQASFTRAFSRHPVSLPGNLKLSKRKCSWIINSILQGRNREKYFKKYIKRFFFQYFDEYNKLII